MDEKTNKALRKAAEVFLTVLIGCIIGWIYEMLFYRIDRGEFIKRGQGFGPWLPIYGFGAIGIIVLMHGRKLSAVVVFLLTALGAGVFEFVVGWALFTFFNGLRLWDYNVEIWSLGNIGGYVCLRSVLVFGILGVLFCKAIMPLTKKIAQKTNIKVLLCITVPLALMFFSDLVYGYIIKSLTTGSFQ